VQFFLCLRRAIRGSLRSYLRASRLVRAFGAPLLSLSLNVIKLISIFRDAKTPIDTMFFTRKIKIRRGATLPPNVHAFFGYFLAQN